MTVGRIQTMNLDLIDQNFKYQRDAGDPRATEENKAAFIRFDKISVEIINSLVDSGYSVYSEGDSNGYDEDYTVFYMPHRENRKLTATIIFDYNDLENLVCEIETADLKKKLQIDFSDPQKIVRDIQKMFSADLKLESSQV